MTAAGNYLRFPPALQPSAPLTPEQGIAAEIRRWERWWTRRRQQQARKARALQIHAKGMNDSFFTGTLAFLDSPSDGPPTGSEGHRVVIPRTLAAQTLHQLVGMPVNLDSDLAGHNQRQIVGVIIDAHIDGDALKVKGRLYDKNQKDLVALLQGRGDTLGMSFEASEVSVSAAAQGGVFVLTEMQWTGAAVLRRDKAAFRSTEVRLAA